MKTAVAVVRSTVQLLMLRPRSLEEYRDGLHRVLEDNSRVEGLVSRMLMLARFEEHTPDKEEVTDLFEAIQTVVAELQGWSEAHGVKLEAELIAHARVRLAPEKSEVLISNLAVNAVQHSDPGSSVRIGLHGQDASPQIIVLTVEDVGAGISEEALPHIFERFYRQDTSRSRRTGGAGLGLAICHAIVQAAGGTIEVRSTLGKGTRVTVSFRSD